MRPDEKMCKDENFMIIWRLIHFRFFFCNGNYYFFQDVEEVRSSFSLFDSSMILVTLIFFSLNLDRQSLTDEL